MCATCGCSHGETRIENQPHGRETGEFLHFDPVIAARAESRLVQVERDILSKNDALAEANRAQFARLGTFAINLVSSPGSGKTTLLVRTVTDLGRDYPCAVIEGDQETSNDAERIRATGVPAIQINTGRGCHLDAQMVGRAAEGLDIRPGGFLFIENVGNLVCPAAFDLGEASRVAIFSVTEGEDKPVKYPDIFASADLVILNKTDLLPYLTYDVGRAEESLRKVNASAPVIHVSATSGQGLEQWYAWLRRHLTRQTT